MSKTDLVYIKDIQQSVEKIIEYTLGISYDEFSENVEKQDAIIRRFQIIGEAAGKLSQGFKNKYPEFPAREAKGMRNILVHEYNEVQLEDLWEAITVDIPRLQSLINEIE